MAARDIEVELDTKGVAATGLDLGALREDVQTEVTRFAEQIGVADPKPNAVPAPEGAQGMDQLIHWAMHVAQEPAMFKVYVRTFLFTLNEIAEARRKDAEPQGKGDTSFVIRVKALGKDIAFPVAKSAIKALFDDSSDD